MAEESEIVRVSIWADFGGDGKPLRQWCDVTLRIPKDYNWEANGKALLAKLKRQAELIGRGE